MLTRYLFNIAKAIIIVVFVMSVVFVSAQTDTLKVMYYNTLNFPDGGDPDRELAFRAIQGYLQADIILINELTSNAGAVMLLNHAINVFGESNFQKAVFSDGPDTDNMLFYNSEKLALYSQYYINNWPRYIDEYVLYYKSANLASGEDTIFFHFYSSHFKANDDEQAARLVEANNFKARINSLNNAENIFFGGDLNLYTDDEPAYDVLINDGVYPLNDPLPAGNWHNNYTYRHYHTQSTRTDDFGGGSSGGMDDRFDFILFSNDVQNGTNGVTYMPNSCIAFGNDGNHLNKALIDSPVNTNLPDSIIQALYYMSDHLPVVCDIKVNASTALYTGTPDIAITEIMYNGPEIGLDTLEFIELYNRSNQVVDLGGCYFSEGFEYSFPTTTLNPGEIITVAYSSDAMQNTFGVSSYQWTSGGLNNGGEPIVFKDLFGFTIDSVYYDDAAPWPGEADGDGYSMVLCDPYSDNTLGENWEISQNFVTNNGGGIPIYASPGFSECILPPIAGFNASAVEILMGESISFTDASGNEPTSWNWSFEGGNPLTSTNQNQVVVYNMPGIYNVQLSVSNSNGSDVLLKEDYITVLDNNPVLIVTEIMQNPGAVGDTEGEWFEVFNPTNVDIDMNGWTIKDEGTDSHIIGSAVIVPAKGFAVLGRNASTSINGNYTCNYEYSSFLLANGDDEIVILNLQLEEIDRIEYDGGPNWPDPAGASMVFSGTASDDNMNYNFWETSAIREETFQGTTGDNGSPGINGTPQNLVLPGFELDVKVYLEGPLNGTIMNVDLNGSSVLPILQPYNANPWNYSGSEMVTSILNPNIVDWVLVELRDATSASSATSVTAIDKQAAFLLNNGNIVGLDGSSILSFTNTISQSLFVVVFHRNHLPVMSATGLIESGGIYSFDFTTDVNKAYNSGQKNVNGNACMFAANGEAIDNIVDDLDISFWKSSAGKQGYYQADFNLDKEVNNLDKIDVWLPNEGAGSQVPE